jgi:protein-S-isoprenylcysteine O-methyltransferase Ste14
MKFLELVVPPPVLLLIVGALMWLLHRHLPVLHWHSGYEFTVSRLLLGVALIVFCMAVYQFWRHRTTVNPMRIDNSSSLITRGVYSLSRNPIYLADAILLLAWAIWLGNFANLLLVAVFMAYITRFQIRPEERMLEHKFGDSCRAYLDSVRRWL